MSDSMAAAAAGVLVCKATLEQVLANRDRRVLRQQALLAQHGKPVLSLTLVTPGPIKDSPDLRALYCVAIESVEQLLGGHGWRVLGRDSAGGVTGPEVLYAIDADAYELKRALSHLEDHHPLGRLWDLDVICPSQGGLSRRSLGLVARACLLCGEAAHACARSRAHPLAELTAAVAKRIHGYRTQTVA